MKSLICIVLLGVGFSALVAAAPDASQNRQGETSGKQLEEWVKALRSEGVGRDLETCMDHVLNTCPLDGIDCFFGSCSGLCNSDNITPECKACVGEKCGTLCTCAKPNEACDEYTSSCPIPP